MVRVPLTGKCARSKAGGPSCLVDDARDNVVLNTTLVVGLVRADSSLPPDVVDSTTGAIAALPLPLPPAEPVIVSLGEGS